MANHADPDRTIDEVPSDPLDAGMAAAFGPDSGPPLAAIGSVVKALGSAPVQLRTPATEPSDPIVKPHSDAVPSQTPEHLQIHGEIARGGMGAILKGRDTELGRDVAVKVLLETHQGRTEMVQRFVEEAQIAGQLQHPGVVPVYEMGQFPDKRPYFTMKLVKGRTLAKWLAQRKGPLDDWPALLKVFEQVCQAIAYAHARGVIHRDLKPSNIMVGTYGEVQLMDWGLAKVLKQGGRADETSRTPAEATVIHLERGGSVPAGSAGSPTQAGAVLGTPAYMAPEQARGEVDKVDERCDVFGLGAILCEILSEKPPFGGPSEEAMGQAAAGALADAFARLDRSGTDGELIALTKRCLAAEPGKRPRDAGIVATELAAYQSAVQERLRKAELKRAAAEALAEEAKAKAAKERKWRQRILGLTWLTFVLFVVGKAWWEKQKTEIVQRVAQEQKDADSAQRKALELKLAVADFNLGLASLQQARFVQARTATQDCLELLPKSAESEPLRQAAIRQLQRCERFAHLDGKLFALLSGNVEPADAAEYADFAWICGSNNLPRRAVRLYSGAFIADPKLADDLEQMHRYHAACYAVLAAAGQGHDATRLPNPEIVSLRGQALKWLRADLERHRQLSQSDDRGTKSTVRTKLLHWQENTDLASVRDKTALDELPADEREDWRNLWADVNAVLQTVSEKVK